MGSPEPRRKRKRTLRSHANIRRKDFPLPQLSVICCICTMVAVCLRKRLLAGKFETRDPSRERKTQLAAILERHEISNQVPRQARSLCPIISEGTPHLTKILHKCCTI